MRNGLCDICLCALYDMIYFCTIVCSSSCEIFKHVFFPPFTLNRMAGDQGNCSVQGIGESSDSTIELNVKMLDSRVYTFRVNKDVRLL